MSFRQTLHDLYHGWDSKARAFRFSLLAFDIVSILFFIVSSLMRDAPWIYVVDAIIAGIILLDLTARFYISNRPLSLFGKVVTWVDIIVVISLLLPAFLESLLFLRILRALRLLRTYHVLKDLRTESKFFLRNEEAIQAGINLGVFVFVMSAIVYVVQVRHNDMIANYVDALYFTVAALTTTGFGDITLTGDDGHLLSVFIMIVGVALFVRLVRAVFQPARVSHKCPDCGLNRHDKDAVHCKHCGRVLAIETSGDSD
jgi:voltage-gated potassium channel